MRLKILYFFLLFLLFLDVSLLRELYRQKYTAFFTALRNNILFVNKDFIVYNNYEYSDLDYGKLKVIEGDKNIPTYTTALFKARISGSPFFDKKLGYYYLPISIRAERKKLKANLILSTVDTQKLLIHFAKKGKIGESLNFNSYRIGDTLNLLKVGFPLIIQVYFQKEVQDFINKLSNCDDFCRDKMKELSNLSIKTDLYFNKISNDELTDDVINIGPTYSLIIYEE